MVKFSQLSKRQVVSKKELLEAIKRLERFRASITSSPNPKTGTEAQAKETQS